ncbi:MAG: glycosyltransferase family 2 protein [Planctomycetia bacterium]
MESAPEVIMDAQNAVAVDVTLFIACYNEQDNILAAIANVVCAATAVGCSYDIVIIDDASTDHSVELIRGYMDAHPEVPIKLLINGTNQGLGTNYSEAAFHGRGVYYRLIVGDDEERRESIQAVLEQLGKADMILTYHADTSHRSLSRRIVSRCFTAVVNLLSGNHLRYYNGLAVHRRHDVQRWHSHAHGFGFQADMITRLLDFGATYVEVPVVPKERTEGASKAFTFRNICSVSHTLLEIFIRRVARILYPKNFAKLANAPRSYETAAFRAGAGGNRPASE